ncbi:MAG: 4Fe-4S dicluster domain-containing protein [Syntrophobacteraceae bacterium]
MANGVDRRLFLKGLTLGAVALGDMVAFGDLLWASTLPNGQKVVLARMAIFVDKALCCGCRVCEMVCANLNCEGRNTSSLARLSVEKEYIKGDYDPKVCYQCSDPPCLKVCPVEALHVEEQNGTFARVIDESLCIGCQQCIEACQQHFRPSRPKFDEQKQKSIKCHLCFGDPQCVKFCPTGALRVERSEEGLLVGYPQIKED